MHRNRSLSRLLSVLSLTFTLVCAVSAQTASPNGSFGFLISSSITRSDFNSSALNATGLAFLGVMNFDGAGNVAGTYTYEVDANNLQSPKTTNGSFTGTWSGNADGTGTLTIALDNKINLTLIAVPAEGGNSLQLAASAFQFPATCGCNTAGMTLAGTARANPVASLNGSFAFQLLIAPNASVNIGVGSFDGAGNISLSFTFIGASNANGQPAQPFPLALAGTYTINPDGTGTISLPAVPNVTNAQTFGFVTTDNGSGILLIQLDRAGSGVESGIARMQ